MHITQPMQMRFAELYETIIRFVLLVLVLIVQDLILAAFAVQIT